MRSNGVVGASGACNARARVVRPKISIRACRYQTGMREFEMRDERWDLALSYNCPVEWTDKQELGPNDGDPNHIRGDR